MKITKARVIYLYNYIRTFATWLIVASLVGAIGGVVGSFFHIAVNHATGLRAEHSWLLYLLPVGGLIIAACYRLLKVSGQGTNDIIDSTRNGDNVPVRLIPAIFLSTVITHVCGGSAGREGAALQIGGGIGSQVGRWLRLDENNMRIVTTCGMSAVFAALFGTPLTAVLFPLEFVSVGVILYSALLPCICSSVVAYEISLKFGIEPTRFYILPEKMDIELLVKVAILSILVAGVSILFCLAMHKVESIAHRIENTYLRIAVGGCIVVALSMLLGTDLYNGTSEELLSTAMTGGDCPTWAFLIKILLTAITLGFGFKGGEIVPTFVVGACFGRMLAPLMGLPLGFGAAIGLVGVFCGNVNCPLAAILLGVELFGGEDITYFALTCAITYMLSGYFGIYKSQKIVYSKTDSKYLDRFTR